MSNLINRDNDCQSLCEIQTLIQHKLSCLFREIRECLKLDPDHKQCFPFYKKIRKVAKLLQDTETALEVTRDYDACIDSAQRVLTQEPKERNVRFLAFQFLCKCYTDNSETTQAINNCKEALKIKKETNILCDSADAYLAAEMFDDGNLHLSDLCTSHAENNKEYNVMNQFFFFSCFS